MQYAVYISDIPVTLKQAQGHQVRYEVVDPKQGYNHAVSETSLNVHEKKQHYVFYQQTCQLSPLNMCKRPKQWYIHDLFGVLNNPTRLQFNWMRKKKKESCFN